MPGLAAEFTERLLVGAGDTLDRPPAEERREADATCVGEPVFGAWARKPGSDLP